MAMAMGSFASRVVATRVVATDGTGDYTNIQDAINSLPATGGCVYVKEGTYTITAPITFPVDNIALRGCGKSTKITCAALYNNDMVYALNRLGIILETFWVYGSGLGSNNGVRITNSHSCLLYGIYVEHCRRGIYASGTTSYLSCSQCDMTTNTASAIQISGTWGRNSVINCSAYLNTGTGIWINAGDHDIIIGNIFYDNTSAGIAVDGSDNHIIKGNVCYDNLRDGINIDSDSDGCIIEGNQCNNNGRRGIWIENVNCDKNIVVSNHALGNTTANFTDAGTNTQIGHNIFV